MAEYPEDLSYTADHEWVAGGNDTVVRVGVTAYLADALGDIRFVTLPVAGDEVDRHDSVAELESAKSVTEVLSPVTGVVARVNEAVAASPHLINEDPYGVGWLFAVDMSDPEELDDLLDVNTYTDRLEER